LLLQLDAANLRALARGCGLLAAGAGGDPQIALLTALLAVQDRGPVAVVDLDELHDDALVVPCALIGAPQLGDERILSGEEGRVLCRVLEDLHHARVGALMCFEAAGVNGMVPATWAAQAGLPLLDADGAGRSFPGFQQRAMHVAGVPASPVVLTDGRDNVLVIHAADDDRAARLARSAAAGLGGVCAAAGYAMTAGRARTAAIAGSLSRAVTLGRAIESRGHPVGLLTLAEALDGTVLIEGRVTEFERSSVTVDGTARDAGRQMRIELHGGFVIALEDGEVRASVPDLIAVLSADTAAPIASETLRRGQRVAVLAAPAHPVWRTARGLAVAGPEAFGYAIEYPHV
jgi:hypothetical protein